MQSKAITARRRPCRPRGVPTPTAVRIQPEIERAGMHEQSLQDVLVPAHVRAPEATGLIEMRTRSLEQFAASSEQARPAVAPDPPSIRIDRVACGFLIGPALRGRVRVR